MSVLTAFKDGAVPAFLVGGPLDGSMLEMPEHMSGEFSIDHGAGRKTMYAAAEPLCGGGRNWRVVTPSLWRIRFETGHARRPVVEADVKARRWCAAVAKAEALVMTLGFLSVDLSEARLVWVRGLEKGTEGTKGTQGTEGGRVL
jgi:hypothetical protein